MAPRATAASHNEVELEDEAVREARGLAELDSQRLVEANWLW